jgi:HlyD family secretion protein
MVQQIDFEVRQPSQNDLLTNPQRVSDASEEMYRVRVSPKAYGRRCFQRLWTQQSWWRRAGLVLVLGATVAGMSWQPSQPKEATVIQPVQQTITESLAASGSVRGVRESLIGTFNTGIVAKLFVREGDQVAAGDQLALLKSNVARAQVQQAQARLNTARAQLAKVLQDPLRSAIDVEVESLRQSHARLIQQRNEVARGKYAVAQAQAQLNQLQAELELTVQEFERSTQLAARGLLARVEGEQAQANLRVAQEKVQAQQQVLALSQADMRIAQAGVAAAAAAIRAQEARLRTAQTGARPEEVRVAQEQVEEAKQAVQVAYEQAQDAVVTAPFDGVITVVYTEVGQAVGTQGILKLVSRDIEVRVDVDEDHLADLSVGQPVTLSSHMFHDRTLDARVTALAAAVDATRGTITVTIVPSSQPDWIRPGQTLNVNIITNAAAQRLLVPATAIIRVGDQSGVLVVEDGRAQQKHVSIRPPTVQGVPVLAGLREHDRVILDPKGIEPGEAVRMQEPRQEDAS